MVFALNKFESWSQVANLLPNRTARQVRERYKNFLSPGLTNKPWTKEEDNLLKEAYDRLGPKWAKITSYFNGRSEINIKNRWTSLQKVIPLPIENNEKQFSVIEQQADADFDAFDSFEFELDPHYDSLDFQI